LAITLMMLRCHIDAAAEHLRRRHIRRCFADISPPPRRASSFITLMLADAAVMPPHAAITPLPRADSYAILPAIIAPFH